MPGMGSPPFGNPLILAGNSAPLSPFHALGFTTFIEDSHNLDQ
jgi:hypothetical protein